MEALEVLKQYALSFLGVPYRFGGRNRLEGLDCSQFVIEQLVALGGLPHGFDSTAQSLYTRFKDRECPPEIGALAFYGADRKTITHVALCLNANQMIEAGGGTSSTVSREQAIERNAMVRIRPIRYRKDYLCSVLPNYLK